MATHRPEPRESPALPRAFPAETKDDLQLAGRDLMRWVGSIQVAVILLALFAVVLFLGTLLESRHDRRTAHQLIYRTWWFALLLGLLGANILLAALKKWPWKRHQIGFLITHLGLITLVTSGLLTALAGESGVLVMVDSPDTQFQRFGLHATDFVIDRDRQTIRVQKNGVEVLRVAFDPGPLAWGDSGHAPFPTDLLTRVLGWVGHPWPHGWSRDLGDVARLDVLAFCPHTKQLPFNPQSAPGKSTFPAVEFQLGSPATGLLAPQWVGYHDGRRALQVGPGLVEFLARDLRPEQLAEFEKPAPTSAKGQLALGLGGKAYRIDVADALPQRNQPLGDSGWRCTLLQYLSNFQDVRDAKVSDPAVSFELAHSDGRRLAFALTARRDGELFPLPNRPASSPVPSDLWAWYHPPDSRYGDESLRAVLQFATAADGRLHYRSFSSSGERFAFEKAGVIAKGDEWQRIWAGMQFKLQVTDFLPHAAPGPHFIPLDVKPPREEDAQPALRCRLTNDGDAAEFWLGKTDGGLTAVTVGGDHFEIGYNSTLRPLGFELTLLKAEQTNDPGSNLPASQRSFVWLREPAGSVDGTYEITLNEPLEHRGFRIYQTDFVAVGQDDKARPVNRALLTVTRDPGLYFKYAGSIMVALGIALMFYMRAYFFKRRV
jgi:hypothetical protein